MYIYSNLNGKSKRRHNLLAQYSPIAQCYNKWPISSSAQKSLFNCVSYFYGIKSIYGSVEQFLHMMENTTINTHGCDLAIVKIHYSKYETSGYKSLYVKKHKKIIP